MRDARGGEELSRRRVEAAFGVEARVVSGDEEARLTFRGALSGLAVDRAEAIAVFDIGGGSTEVVVGRLAAEPADLDYAHSFDVGSVRLTERHVAHDPPTPEELRGRRARARATRLRRVPPAPRRRPPSASPAR